ncbi:MAG: formylglycine-generating enzyme family protein [Planctomycetota bacterium]|nr:formylglycine-generating enzyme family protein [Planctomycetota bacterium]
MGWKMWALVIVVVVLIGCRGGGQKPVVVAPVSDEPSTGTIPEGQTLVRTGPKPNVPLPKRETVHPPVEGESEKVVGKQTPPPAQKSSITEGMVLIKKGAFPMGFEGAGYLDTQPVRSVTLEDYYIDKYEVTNKEFNDFLKASGYDWKGRMQAWPGGVMPEEMANLPVVYVSWEDAKAYAEWAGKRLPTEAEWEKAARGIDKRKYPWGDTFDSKKCNVKESGHGKVVAVDSFPEGQSPYGCFNMVGNVAEWVADYYDAYPGNEAKVEKFGQRYRVIRGGSFESVTGYTTYERYPEDPSLRFKSVGFRCVISAQDAEKADKERSEGR